MVKCFFPYTHYGICCIWAWSSSHFNFIFFTHSRVFFSFHFCLACGVFKIWTFIKSWSYCLAPSKMSTWTPWFPGLHSKGVWSFQVLTKQPFGHIRTSACIHLAKPFWEPLWTYFLSSIASPCSSWIEGGTFWGARSSTTNDNITYGLAITHETRWGYCIKATYIVWNYT